MDAFLAQLERLPEEIKIEDLVKRIEISDIPNKDDLVIELQRGLELGITMFEKHDVMQFLKITEAKEMASYIVMHSQSHSVLDPFDESMDTSSPSFMRSKPKNLFGGINENSIRESPSFTRDHSKRFGKTMNFWDKPSEPNLSSDSNSSSLLKPDDPFSMSDMGNRSDLLQETTAPEGFESSPMYSVKNTPNDPKLFGFSSDRKITPSEKFFFEYSDSESKHSPFGESPAWFDAQASPQSDDSAMISSPTANREKFSLDSLIPKPKPFPKAVSKFSAKYVASPLKNTIVTAADISPTSESSLSARMMDEKMEELNMKLKNAENRCKELELLNETLKSTKGSPSRLNNQIDKLELQLKAAEDKCSELQEEIEKSEQQDQSLRKQILDLTKKMNTLTQENASYELDLRNLKQELRESELKNNMNFDTVLELTRSKDASNVEQINLVKGLQNSIYQLEEEKHKRELYISNLESRFGTVSSQLKSTEEHLSAKVDENSNLKSEIENQLIKLSELDFEVEKLKDDCNELKDENEGQRQEIERLHNISFEMENIQQYPNVLPVDTANAQSQTELVHQTVGTQHEISYQEVGCNVDSEIKFVSTKNEESQTSYNVRLSTMNQENLNMSGQIETVHVDIQTEEELADGKGFDISGVSSLSFAPERDFESNQEAMFPHQIDRINTLNQLVQNYEIENVILIDFKADLKKNLGLSHTSIMEIRQEMDIRRHYDVEIESWIQNLNENKYTKRYNKTKPELDVELQRSKKLSAEIYKKEMEKKVFVDCGINCEIKKPTKQNSQQTNYVPQINQFMQTEFIFSESNSDKLLPDRANMQTSFKKTTESQTDQISLITENWTVDTHTQTELKRDESQIPVPTQQFQVSKNEGGNILPVIVWCFAGTLVYMIFQTKLVSILYNLAIFDSEAPLECLI